MAGDPSNARLWADADVYVSFDTEAPNPADVDTAFGVDWELVGLLDGDEGFTESRDEDVEDLYAWGGILVRTARKNFKLTRTFTALEDNETTFRLRWPGSTDDTIVVPSGARVERVRVAFETVDGDTVHRLISTYQAEITVDGDINENESELSSIPFIVTVFPNDDGELFTVQTADVTSS